MPRIYLDDVFKMCATPECKPATKRARPSHLTLVSNGGFADARARQEIRDIVESTKR